MKIINNGWYWDSFSKSIIDLIDQDKLKEKIEFVYGNLYKDSVEKACRQFALNYIHTMDEKECNLVIESSILDEIQIFKLSKHIKGLDVNKDVYARVYTMLYKILFYKFFNEGDTHVNIVPTTQLPE